jgi:ATP-binding cassette, subfamily D (ALD), peroxisomal long-chain fatty acid import protein
MYAYKDLLELAGLTTRLYTLLSTLHNLPPLPIPSDSTSVEVSCADVKVPTTVATGDLDDGCVPTSNEVVLVKDLSFKLEEGEHLMITGSNGVGKTSVARVLAGLWPVQEGGEVRRPADDGGRMGVFVVPQRVYMVEGTLLDQVIYPNSYADFKESGRTEVELTEILTAAHLAYLPGREGGWSAKKEWRDVLSGGEKQRVSHPRGLISRLSLTCCTSDGHGACILPSTQVCNS